MRQCRGFCSERKEQQLERDCVGVKRPQRCTGQRSYWSTAFIFILLHERRWKHLVSEIKDTLHKKQINICYMLFICLFQSICMICLFVFSNKNTRTKFLGKQIAVIWTDQHTHTHTLTHSLPWAISIPVHL